MKSGLVLILALTVASHAQSLGDLARANREREKPHAAKVLTDDDVKSAESKNPGAASGTDAQFENMRKVLREVCADPKTNEGRVLTDYDKRIIEEAAKPLRARKTEFQNIQKKYQDEFSALNEEMDSEIRKAMPVGGMMTDVDRQRIMHIRQDYDSRRMALAENGRVELQGYAPFMRQLDAASRECPAAARSVPQ